MKRETETTIYAAGSWVAMLAGLAVVFWIIFNVDTVLTYLTKWAVNL